jgi:hypothetical protein
MIRFTAWKHEVTYDDGEFVSGQVVIRQILENLLKGYPSYLLLTKDQIAKPERSRVEWLKGIGVPVKVIEFRPEVVTENRP